MIEEWIHSVKKNYDLIANQYCNDFGTNLDDIKLIEKFEPHLKKGSTIVDFILERVGVKDEQKARLQI